VQNPSRARSDKRRRGEEGDSKRESARWHGKAFKVENGRRRSKAGRQELRVAQEEEERKETVKFTRTRTLLITSIWEALNTCRLSRLNLYQVRRYIIVFWGL